VLSVALNRFVPLQTTASVLRHIRKLGGLDAYLFKAKSEQLGEAGLFLRKSVKAAHEARKERGIPCSQILDPKLQRFVPAPQPADP
jgi:ribosomal protein L28